MFAINRNVQSISVKYSTTCINKLFAFTNCIISILDCNVNGYTTVSADGSISDVEELSFLCVYVFLTLHLSAKLKFNYKLHNIQWELYGLEKGFCTLIMRKCWKYLCNILKNVHQILWIFYGRRSGETGIKGCIFTYEQKRFLKFNIYNICF